MRKITKKLKIKAVKSSKRKTSAQKKAMNTLPQLTEASKIYLKNFINSHKTNIARFLFIIAGIELLTAAFFHLYSIPSFRETIVLATTVQPERFTELYFEDHTDLPKDALPDTDYSFKFSVHNLEYRDIEYNYESYIDLGDEKAVIDQGSFTLKHDESKTIDQGYVLLEELPRSRVVVNLKNKNNQQIHFWIGEGAK